MKRSISSLTSKGSTASNKFSRTTSECEGAGQTDSVNETPSSNAQLPAQDSVRSEKSLSGNASEDIDLGGLTEEEYLEALKKNERAEIWGHFTRRFELGKIKAFCHYCKHKGFAAHPKINGTTALINHMEKCTEYPPNKEKWSKKQKVLTYGKSKDLVVIGCTQEEITKACVQMVVLDELPFSHVEGEGFRYFCRVACPHWKVPSRKTIARDV
ncbi:unnamed protein product, partial [Cuscuta epithymum]